MLGCLGIWIPGNKLDLFKAFVLLYNSLMQKMSLGRYAIRALVAATFLNGFIVSRFVLNYFVRVSPFIFRPEARIL